MPKNEPFSSLSIPKMRYTNTDENSYLVYSDEKNFTRVLASTAFDAIEKSGISKPYRIIHEDNFNRKVAKAGEIISEEADIKEPDLNGPNVTNE